MAMKTTLLGSLFCLTSFLAFSQVPQGFNYQAIARGSDFKEIVNATFQVKISILTDTTGFYSTGGSPSAYVWEEQQTVKTNNIGLFNMVIGNLAATKIQGSAASFSAINWEGQALFVGVKINYPGPNTWKQLGSANLLSVPYAMVSAKADTAKAIQKGTNLSVVSGNDLTTDALFEVKRKDGQTVFAVYPDAVNIYVPRGTKGSSKGGFAIGGFDSKLSPQDYFRVTPDSVRIYINNAPPSGKGATKGGFAIGGFDDSKGLLPNFFMNVTGASAVNTVDSAAQILWYPNKQAFLAGRINIVSPDSVGTNSTALGYKSRAIGNYSQAFGYRAIARGDYSTSIGKLSIAGARAAGVSTASNAFAFGNGSKATGNDSYAFGSGAEASGLRSFAFGSVGIDTTGAATSITTKATGNYSTAIGMGAQATSLGAMALGVATLASGVATSTLGYASAASNNYAVAIGYKANASGAYSAAFGYYSNSTLTGAYAFGYRAAATGNYSAAIGPFARTYSDYSSAFGRSASATGTSSTAVGYGATTNANDASAFGRSASANGATSVAIGYGATTSAGGTQASAFGQSATATGASSMALGVNAASAGSNSTSIGYQSTTQAAATYATAIGYQAKADATNSFSFGNNSEASASNSFAIGTYGIDVSGNANTTPTMTTASYSLAVGMGTQATALGSVGIGVNSTAAGQRSIAIGYGTTASGLYSTSVGSGTSTGTSASYSSAFGYGSSTSGSYATALGYSAQANGNKSISIGAYYNYTYYRFLYNIITHKFYLIPVTITKYNIASNDYSIAFGNGNTATDGGFALGSNNNAYAIGAVAIGHSNTADSSYSFAAGYGNSATGYNSFALGESVTSQSKNCVTVGSYNIPEGDQVNWVATDPIFVVGNGTSSASSNALKVLKNGQLVLPEIGTIGVANWLVVDGSGNVGIYSSSIRYKTDINPLNDVSWLYKLNPVDFVYKNDPTKAVQSGLIAEEVEKINKQYVTYKNGVPDGVSYPSLFAPMIKAIQDQKNTIESLKSENESLRGRLVKLESIVSTLIQGSK